MFIICVYHLQVDHAIYMMCGGIPWQAYFQRVLSSRDAKVARTLSVFAGFGCFCAAIPAVVVGASLNFLRCFSDVLRNLEN